LNTKLIQSDLSCWSQILHTTLNREETLEMIVPDACPDILEILDTHAVPELRRWECGEGNLSLSGRVCCAVLYRPEGEGGVARLRAELPLQFTAELEGMTAQCRCLLTPRISLAETRTINPRKVLIRVALTLELTGFAPIRLCWGTELENRESLGIQVRRSAATGSFVRAVVQRPFSCSETVQIPGSRPPMEELLSVQARAFDSEARLVGEKLIFKGAALVHLLYRTEEGELAGADFELPFSQIAQVGETEEGASFQLDIQVTATEAHSALPEGRGVELELELLAQLLVRERRGLDYLSDAYAVRGQGTPEFDQCPLPELLEQGVRRVSLREQLDAPESVDQVCELRITPLQTRMVGGELCAQLRTQVLCRSESGQWCSLQRSLQVTCPLNVPEGASVEAVCVLTETDASPAGDGVELRLGAEFQLMVQRQQRIRILSGFALEEESQEEGELPSIVLRQLEPGESLWDVAKAYRTTQVEIEQANGLTGEAPAAGRMLLIPRRR
jgi:hypothetical protein